MNTADFVAVVDRESRVVIYKVDGRPIVRLHLLAGDNRSSMILRSGGVSQQSVMKAWRTLVAAMQPGIILDIGANHGELSLALLPPETSEVMLFEPNPHLCEVLRHSIASHAAGGRYQLHQAALSSAVGQAVFHVDRKWSGTSSLDFEAPDAPYKGKGEQEFERIDVAINTLDNVIADNPRLGQGIAIKIDVEGHEPKVLKGAERTLARSRFFVLLEFSDAQLRRSGANPLEFAASLLRLGQMFRISTEGDLRPVEEVASLRGSHCDIVVSNDPALIALLRSPPAGRTPDVPSPSVSTPRVEAPTGRHGVHT